MRLFVVIVFALFVSAAALAQSPPPAAPTPPSAMQPPPTADQITIQLLEQEAASYRKNIATLITQLQAVMKERDELKAKAAEAAKPAEAKPEAKPEPKAGRSQH